MSRPTVHLVRLSCVLALVSGCLWFLATMPALEARAPRDFTFFILSDIHVGAENPNAQPPVTPAMTLERIKARIATMASLVGRPYPERPELASLRLGSVQSPRGILVLGDLTDGADEPEQAREQWNEFERLFPRTGVVWNDKTIPVFALAGNHDGPVSGPQRQGVVERNRLLARRGMVSDISPNGAHVAFEWNGAHFVSLNLYPADAPDAEQPFKFGSDPSRWNDPESALVFLKHYLSSRVGKSGRPVFVMHHYGVDEMSENDWYWWTARQRAEYYRALAPYNIAAILHGHNHHADHYRWPDPAIHAADLAAIFGSSIPSTYRQYDVVSCGQTGWVMRIVGDRLVGTHYARNAWSTEPGGAFVKSLKPNSRR